MNTLFKTLLVALLGLVSSVQAEGKFDHDPSIITDVSKLDPGKKYFVAMAVDCGDDEDCDDLVPAMLHVGKQALKKHARFLNLDDITEPNVPWRAHTPNGDKRVNDIEVLEDSSGTTLSENPDGLGGRKLEVEAGSDAEAFLAEDELLNEQVAEVDQNDRKLDESACIMCYSGALWYCTHCPSYGGRRRGLRIRVDRKLGEASQKELIREARANINARFKRESFEFGFREIVCRDGTQDC